MNNRTHPKVERPHSAVSPLEASLRAERDAYKHAYAEALQIAQDYHQAIQKLRRLIAQLQARP
jgi:hypothetical protein